MRKISVFVLVLILLFTGCVKESKPVTVELYYKTESALLTENRIPDSLFGAVSCELRCDVAPDILAEYYFRGPDISGLVAPFPKGTHLVSFEINDRILKMVISDEIGSLSAIDAVFASACISRTFLQLDCVEKIVIEAETATINGEKSITMSRDSLLLSDDTTMNINNQISVYFPDTEHRYVIPVTLNYGDLTDVELVRTMVAYMMHPAVKDDMEPVIPPGTLLTDVSIDNGICVLDFTGDFLRIESNNTNELRVRILSIIDSVTEIDGINGVRFFVNGESVLSYQGYDLGIVFQRDESSIGPVRSTFNEVDSSLFLVRENDNTLIEIPCRLKTQSDETNAETLFRKLMSFEPINGMIGPKCQETERYSVYVENNTCYIVFFESILDNLPLPRELFEQCITKTLLSLPEIEKVEIFIES